MKKYGLHITITNSWFFRRSFCVLLLLFFSSQLLQAQSDRNSEYRIKAVFLYNFTRFVDWPPTAFSFSTDPFIIGIIGKDPFDTYLEEAVIGEHVGTHPIIIRRIDDWREIPNCHILYINSNDPGRIKTILSSLADRNILTVSESPDFPRLGGIVRFFTEKNKIRIEINALAAKAAQLNISSKLLGVAQVYN